MNKAKGKANKVEDGVSGSQRVSQCQKSDLQTLVLSSNLDFRSSESDATRRVRRRAARLIRGACATRYVSSRVGLLVVSDRTVVAYCRYLLRCKRPRSTAMRTGCAQRTIDAGQRCAESQWSQNGGYLSDLGAHIPQIQFSDVTDSLTASTSRDNQCEWTQRER